VHPWSVNAAAVWMTVLIVINVVLIIRAPTNPIRILTLDALSLVLVALLVLISAWNQQTYYLDAAIALALFSFIGTVVAARRLEERRIL
jgi:multicomponent Na+:H+ antiporter subunit F